MTLTGHVEIWQGERVLRADKVTYDRNTDVAAAHGHVVLAGSERAGAVRRLRRADAGHEGRRAVQRARAARRRTASWPPTGRGASTRGSTSCSRAIYSTCNLCKDNPTAPPLWDMRARSAVQDIENKRIEYRDAVVDMFGVPVAYMPYLTHARSVGEARQRAS